jgi:hypothetical protein
MEYLPLQNFVVTQRVHIYVRKHLQKEAECGSIKRQLNIYEPETSAFRYIKELCGVHPNASTGYYMCLFYKVSFLLSLTSSTYSL